MPRMPLAGYPALQYLQFGRVRRFVTIEVQALAPLLGLGGTNRTRGWMPIVPEKPGNQGQSWRKPPHQEGLRPRNNSGPLTAARDYFPTPSETRLSLSVSRPWGAVGSVSEESLNSRKNRKIS